MASLIQDKQYLPQMEKAVRGNEQFWELPFPVDDVILFLRGRAGMSQQKYGPTKDDLHGRGEALVWDCQS